LDKLLEAYRTVENEMPTALILHSERNGYYNLEKQAQRLRLKRVWLTEKFGLVGKSRLNALYKICDVYVQPSYSEGFGLPILEAFRFNKPVVAVNAPPLNEIIKHNSTGLLIPTERVSWRDFRRTIDFKLNKYSADKLAHAIVRLLRDRKLMGHMVRSIETEKWRWDANRLYPKLLNYFD
jgi:glycosyltransferase involved in cell wall biosynthesis